MIAHIKGKVAEKFISSIVIDVGGVGYELQVVADDYNKVSLDEEVKFYTYHHIREQSQELYGFSSLKAKKIFELLITVQGVGPKAALAILSLGDIESVRNGIASSDSAYIGGASGVGKKTAERVVVDLSDKVGQATSLTDGGRVASRKPINDEALEALISLGYSLNDAALALENVPTDLPTAERVTLALKG